MSNPELSLVIATYNRGALLKRLLQQLALQTLSPESFEIILVDDGSTDPVKPQLDAVRLPYRLRVEVQANAGAAAARHRGVLAARGRVVVITDDDMQVPPHFLEAHLAEHVVGARRVVLGKVRQDADLAMPLFERWHVKSLDQFAERVAGNQVRVVGNNLYTGNVSFLREDYLATGGFDSSLKHSEDAELGLRLEKVGAGFVFSERAWVIHSSDHTSLEKWRRRAFLYGTYDKRIARKHPDVAHADPWRYLYDLNLLSRPLLLAAIAAPERSARLAGLVYSAAHQMDRLGFHGLGLKGTNLAYGIDYFRGLRTEVGSLTGAVKEALVGGLRRTGTRDGNERAAAVTRFVDALGADYEAVGRYEARYPGGARSSGKWPVDVVQKVGLQMMVAYRVMRLLRELRLTVGAKAMSRLIRHAYASDIHWDAQFAPGVLIVHGMGMAISHAAVVGPGCILFHHVTLGFSGSRSGEGGAPTLGTDVHVMAGATLTGPISVGDRTKVMANVVLTRSVPSDFIVEAPQPNVRAKPGGQAERPQPESQDTQDAPMCRPRTQGAVA